MKLRTQRNLTTAMQRGALDAVKYHRFACCARMDGDWELARAFQDTADSDRTQSLSREAEREGLIAHSPDNLRDAIEAEMKEMNVFAKFACEAMEDGDLNAAALFDRISRDKAQSCRGFQTILASMSVHNDGRDVVV